MTHSSLDRRWGPRLGDYLESIHGYVPARKPNLEQIEESHRLLRQSIPKYITCSVLEDVLLVLHYPDKILQFGSSSAAWHAQMIEPIIRLLEIYTETNGLFDHYFGLLCVQVLAFSLQIDVLIRNNCLNLAVRNLPEEASPVMVSMSLSGAIYIAIERGWSHDIDQQGHSFLLSILWSSKKSLFYVSKHIPRLHGWSIIFLAIWLPMKSGRLPRDRRMLLRLYDVLCRYTLAATEDGPYAVIDQVCVWLTSYLGDRGTPLENIPPDPDSFGEVPVFRDALTARLNLSGESRLDRRTASALVGFVLRYYFHSAIASSLDSGSLLFFEAIFNRVWLEIADERCTEDMQYRLTSMDLVISLLRAPSILFYSYVIINRQDQKPEAFDMDTVSKFFAKMLYDADWIGLIGRILLLITLPLNGVEVSANEMLLAQSRLNTLLEQFHTDCNFLELHDLKAVEIFRSHYQDWKKTCDFLKLKKSASQSDLTMTSYYTLVEQVWWRIGKALGLQSQFEHLCLCAYTGCVQTDTVDQAESFLRVCSGCLVTPYCSEKCQKLDWDRWHSLECRS